MSRTTAIFQYLLPLYFGFAVFYDVFTSIYEIVHHGAPLPWEHVPSMGVIQPIDEGEFMDYQNKTGIYASTTLSYPNTTPVYMRPFTSESPLLTTYDSLQLDNDTVHL